MTYIQFKHISSRHNDVIELIRLLENARNRKKNKLFIIEGLRELKLAVQGGYDIKKIVFSASGMSEQEISDYLLELNISHIPCFLADQKLFQTIAYREEIKNVVAVAAMKTLALDRLSLSNNPLILVLENIEKPGNLGAILRSCDAAAVDAVIITDSQTDIYNPNVVRSSLGTLFTNQVAVSNSTELINFLEEKNVNIYITTPYTDKIYTQTDFRTSAAVVMGSEAFGLSEIWMKSKGVKILIPMKGKVDSLNVSVSAAIIIYEAVRQRSI